MQEFSKGSFSCTSCSRMSLFILSFNFGMNLSCSSTFSKLTFSDFPNMQSLYILIILSCVHISLFPSYSSQGPQVSYSVPGQNQWCDHIRITQELFYLRLSYKVLGRLQRIRKGIINNLLRLVTVQLLLTLGLKGRQSIYQNLEAKSCMKRTILKIVMTFVHGHGLPEIIIQYGIQRNKYSNFPLHLLILSLGTPLSS